MVNKKYYNKTFLYTNAQNNKKKRKKGLQIVINSQVLQDVGEAWEVF